MKLYAVRVTTDVKGKTQHVGYLGFDLDARWPLNNETGPEFFNNKELLSQGLKDILKTSDVFAEYTAGSRCLKGTARVFLDAFRRRTGRGRNKPFKLIFELLKFDFTDPENVKSKLMRKIEVNGCEATGLDYHTTRNAFYEAKVIKLK